MEYLEGMRLASLIWANSSSKGQSVKIERILAFAIIASIPIGPVISIGVSGRGIHVALAQILSLLLSAHLIFSKIALFGRLKTGLGIAALLASAMAPPLLLVSDLAPAAVAYFNYATGVMGGIALGYVWARTSRDRMGVIDLGLAVFLTSGGGQLIVNYMSASSLNALHQNAETPWGNSNYVAACLVVGAFVLISRGLETHKLRVVMIPVLISVAAALLTLSRGAALSLAVGLGVLLWTGGRTSWQRFVLRLLSIAMPFGALYILSKVEELRYQGSSHANANIDSRLLLFQAAWNDFLHSPIVGNGWVSFREVSALAVEEQSFAHNFFLSFMQIGGVLFGLTTVFVYLAVMIRAIRKSWLIAPAISAAFTISMSDPFFESTVANLLTLSAVFLAIRSDPSKRETTGGLFLGAEFSEQTSAYRLAVSAERSVLSGQPHSK